MEHSLVHIVNDTPLADSRAIAKGLGIDHHNFMQTVKKYESKVESRFGCVLFKTDDINMPRGGHRKAITHALLSEIQATAIVTLSRNSDKVVEFKLSLVEAFFKAREEIHQVSQSSQPVSTSKDPMIQLYVNTTIEELIDVQEMDDLKCVPIKLLSRIERHDRIEREVKEKELEIERLELEIERKKESLILSFLDDDSNSTHVHRLALPSTASTVSIESVLSKLISEYEQGESDIARRYVAVAINQAGLNMKGNGNKISSYMYSRGYKHITKGKTGFWTKATV